MPLRFSQDARTVSFLAHEHAFRLRMNCVAADHLLLALLDDRDVLALLRDAGVNIDGLRQAMAPRMVPEPESTEVDAVLPRSSCLHKAWGDAHGIAERHGARFIEPEHLLLALVAPDRLSKAAEDLVAFGFGRS